MNEDLLARAVSDWLRDSDAQPANPARSRARAVAQARQTGQARPWHGWWLLPGPRVLMAYPRSSIIAVTLALVAVGLAALSLSAPGEDERAALSPASPDASARASAIHWQTDVVDLQAHSYVLHVEDIAFTTSGVPLEVRSDPGDPTYWTLELEWREHGVDQRMNWYFAADDERWWVTEIRTYDGHEVGEWVYAYGPFFETPLGESFAGDIRIELIGTGRPEDASDIVRAELTIDGLHLSVSPGERGTRTGRPTRDAQDLLASGLRTIRDVLFPRPEPTPEPSPTPEPMWAVDFGDLTLTGQLVDEGTIRVTGDGADHKIEPIVSVAIADDGTVWLARRRAVFALGRPGETRLESGSGPKRQIERIEANGDGSLTVHADGTWRLDDGSWTLLEPPLPRVGYLGSGLDGRTMVRLPDGSVWQVPPRFPDDVRYDDSQETFPSDALALERDGAWVPFGPDEVFPVTRARYPGEWIVPSSLLGSPSGEVWAYNDQALSRFDGHGWEELAPADLARIAGGPVVVREALIGPDDSLWVLTTGGDRQANPAGRRANPAAIQRLLRWRAGAWEVTKLEGEIPGVGRSANFYGLDRADDDGVWLMDRDRSWDYYVGRGGLLRVSSWAPREAWVTDDGSVFGTLRPRSEGLVMVPAGEIRRVEPDEP